MRYKGGRFVLGLLIGVVGMNTAVSKTQAVMLLIAGVFCGLALAYEE